MPQLIPILTDEARWFASRGSYIKADSLYSRVDRIWEKNHTALESIGYVPNHWWDQAFAERVENPEPD